MLQLCKKCAESNADFTKRCVEMCSNILLQRIQRLSINFQRNQHKPYIISAHSVNFLEKYPLTAADSSTRERNALSERVKTLLEGNLAYNKADVS